MKLNICLPKSTGFDVELDNQTVHSKYENIKKSVSVIPADALVAPNILFMLKSATHTITDIIVIPVQNLVIFAHSVRFFFFKFIIPYIKVCLL